MEQVELKYENVLGAHAAFVKSIDWYLYLQNKLAKVTVDTLTYEDQLDLAGAAVIQKFEVLFEVLWKYLKWLLEERLEVVLDSVSPRGVITQSSQLRVITEEQGLLLLALLSLCNKTSHLYKQEVVDMVLMTLSKSYQHIDELVERCNMAHFGRNDCVE